MQMSKSPSRRFPVIVAQLPVTRSRLCHRTVAYRPGSLSEVLTEHVARGQSRSTRRTFPVPSTGCLHHPGRVGKTKIAIEYAYRCSYDYDLVWWIRLAQVKLIC
jgi:hypothetical protein